MLERVAIIGGSVAVVLVGGAAVGLAHAGGPDALLDSCSESTRAATADLAAEVRRTLPDRTSVVEVEGGCDKQPSPMVLTSTGADRAVVARELRDRWDCSVSQGSLPPLWVCADVAGHEAEIDVDDDGSVAASVNTPVS